jgi:hypothetical protein
MSDLPRIAFIDFEASSLGKHGYPIEVAWVFADGEEENHLIQPVPAWTDWDNKAEAINGISRNQLSAEGQNVDVVARRMVSVLTGCALYATAPSWDGKWLSKLLRAASLPRHALRLEDTDMAHRRVMREALRAARIPKDRHRGIMQDIFAKARRKDDDLGPAVHRALADARREQRLWLDIRDRAADMAQQLQNTVDDPVQADEAAHLSIGD